MIFYGVKVTSAVIQGITTNAPKSLVGKSGKMLPTALDWIFCSSMPAPRKFALGTECHFAQLVARMRSEATLDHPAAIQDAKDRAAPPNTVRALFKVTIAPDMLDVLYNGIGGLRARYWASPELGDAATAAALRGLRDKLLAEVSDANSSPLRSERGVEMSKLMVKRALACPSAKIWIAEEQLRQNGQNLIVPRWVRNQNEPGNPRLWSWTPRASILEVKTAWLTPGWVEWVPDCKVRRAEQISRWGFS